jgi:ABC-type multidrug transport system permease subunit
MNRLEKKYKSIILIGIITTFIVSYTGMQDLRQTLLRTFIWALLFILLVAAFTSDDQ